MTTKRFGEVMLWIPEMNSSEAWFRQRWAIAFPDTCLAWADIAVALSRLVPENVFWGWKTMHCYMRHKRIGFVSAVTEFRIGTHLTARFAVFDHSRFMAYGHERMGIRWLAHWQSGAGHRHSLALLLIGRETAANVAQMRAFAEAQGIPLITCESFAEIQANLEEALVKALRYRTSAPDNKQAVTTALARKENKALPLIHVRSRTVELAMKQYGTLIYPRPLPKAVSQTQAYKWLLFIGMFPGVREPLIDDLWRLFFNERCFHLSHEPLHYLRKHRWIAEDEHGGYYLYPQAASTLALVLGVFPQRMHVRQGMFVGEARQHHGHTLSAYHFLVRAYWDVEQRAAKEGTSAWRWRFGASEAWASQYFAYQHKVYSYRPDGYLAFEYQQRFAHFYIEIDGWRASPLVRALTGRARTRSHALHASWAKKLRNLLRYSLSREWQWHYETLPGVLVITENDRIVPILHHLYLTLPELPPTPILVALNDEVDLHGFLDATWWVMGKRLHQQSLRSWLESPSSPHLTQ